MTNKFQLIAILTIVFIGTGHAIYGQERSMTFSNSSNAYYRKTNTNDTVPVLNLFRTRINEITLNPDSTFEFWSRPSMSCFTWHSYEGKWKRNNDSLLFNDNYQVEENGTRVSFKRDARQEFVITFNTDKGTVLTNKSVMIKYEYDFDAHFESPEKIFSLNSNNSIIISYKDILNFDQLASIRIEYLLNYTDKRYKYLTENKTVNLRERAIPNIISVEFIEQPKKEFVFRTIKAVVKEGTLRIVSNSKTKTQLHDYNPDIEFEDSYSLDK